MQVAYLQDANGAWHYCEDTHKIIDHIGKIHPFEIPDKHPDEEVQWEQRGKWNRAVDEAKKEAREEIKFIEGCNYLYSGRGGYIPTDICIHRSIDHATANVDNGPQFAEYNCNDWTKVKTPEHGVVRIYDYDRSWMKPEEREEHRWKYAGVIARSPREGDPDVPANSGWWVEKDAAAYAAAKQIILDGEAKEARRLHKNGYRNISAWEIREAAHKCAKAMGIAEAKAVTTETALVWILAHDKVHGKKATNKVIRSLALAWNRNPEKWKKHFSRWINDRIMHELDARLASVSRRKITPYQSRATKKQED